MNSVQNSEVVVITGASAGVGRAVAHEFAKRGARIALLARGVESLEDTKKEVEALGGQALVVPTDTGDEDQVFKAAETVERKLGPIDIWINNAMVSVFSPIQQITPAEFRRVTDVTYLGYVFGTLAALKYMTPRNHGKILQVGSALARRSIPLQGPYCAAKHAVLGFTQSLRCELLHDKSKVSVTLVELPAVNTPQFRWVRSRLPHKPQPVPPIFQPEVIARAIYWAAHSRRREVYIAWPTWKAILAEKFVPGLADRYLAHTNYQAQQTSQLASRDRTDNLISAEPQKASTHGDFDQVAKTSSWLFWINRHLSDLLGIGARKKN